MNRSKLMIVINAVLFQLLWFACVIGSAKLLIWPSLLCCAGLAVWQLHPKRRHPGDIKLVVIAITLGLVIDTLWIQLDFLNYVDQRPFPNVAPAWIIVLWIGFALTINHSLSWLRLHPALPMVLGAIGGPMSYYAGLKLGAVEYQQSVLIISTSLAVGWGLSLWLMVHLSKQPSAETA